MTCSAGSQTASSQAIAKTPRGFVTDFYKWYTPKTLRENATAAWNLAIKYKSSIFSRELAQLLREDSAAQAKCNELIGLDFDPFLATQDSAEHYQVGAVIRRSNAYRAEIYRLDGGKRSKKPDVIAEFMQKDGHWFFINFHYPDGGDLLTMLREPATPCTVPRSIKK